MAKTVRKSKISAEQLAAAEAEIVSRSKRIEFYQTDYSIELLVNKYAKQEFVIPDYQRKFTWQTDRKTKFIESIHMGLPIPFLFFWEMGDGKLEIVDGSQRIRTLEEYVTGELKLGELEELPSLSGTRFTDLSEGRQLKMLNRSIRGIILSEHADEQARYDMFERINTGSKVANPGEVRRGALRGKFQEMIEDLAKDATFAALAPVSSKSQNERVPEELVTRFFGYGDGLDDYKDSPARFIFEYTKRMNQAFDTDASLEQRYRDRFHKMLAFVQTTFPNGFKKAAEANTTPRVRFEAIAIGSDLALRKKPELATMPVDISGWIEGEDFKLKTTSDAANVRSKLENRIAFVRDRLLEV